LQQQQQQHKILVLLLLALSKVQMGRKNPAPTIHRLQRVAADCSSLLHYSAYSTA